jgi:predicted membrane channel-forming protein YqfA (hemolysin III family)
LETSLKIHTISIYVLVGIVILASFALIVELLPEVEAKMIVIPTLTLIIGWSVFFLFSLKRSEIRNE